MMCSQYPNCAHAGPVMDKAEGMDRHCKTVLPNSTCLYHSMGCLGCTFRPDGVARRVPKREWFRRFWITVWMPTAEFGETAEVKNGQA